MVSSKLSIFYSITAGRSLMVTSGLDARTLSVAAALQRPQKAIGSWLDPGTAFCRQ